MNRCPITYELCGTEKYSKKGLRSFSPTLKSLNDFPYTPKDLIILASKYAAKLSIQGVQPKLSIKLEPSKGRFKIVEIGGVYILKPPHDLYEEIPQNEDLTMKLAKMSGIEVPLHGMIYNIDQSLSYAIKRFDREGKNKRIAVEDFSQLLGYSRETKYESSMEKVVSVIEKHCTFPLLEKIKLFRLVIFNFLIGNEDMHLKNFMLIRKNNLVALSPAYDLVNTSIILKTEEEIALPIGGKKNKLTKKDFVDYFGKERLKLERNILDEEIYRFQYLLPEFENLINISFLSDKMKNSYLELLKSRWQLFG